MHNRGYRLTPNTPAMLSSRTAAGIIRWDKIVALCESLEEAERLLSCDSMPLCPYCDDMMECDSDLILVKNGRALGLAHCDCHTNVEAKLIPLQVIRAKSLAGGAVGADESEEAIHIEGYKVAIKELEAGTADHRSAKTRGLHLNNQTFRIAWDQGYEAAIMAWRLGYDPKELARMRIYDASPITIAATIRELESGRKLLKPDPRKTDGDD